MRYSVVIYDAVGIEEATIVCETKADAQDLAVRCAKMYAGEGYTIEIEKEPERWEGILGTREMRRKARREGKTRRPPTLYEVGDEEETAPAAAEEARTEEAGPRRRERGRRDSRRQSVPEKRTEEPAVEAPRLEPIGELQTEAAAEAPSTETPVAAEEVRTGSRRRRGGRRRRSRRPGEESRESTDQPVEEERSEQAPHVEFAAPAVEEVQEPAHPVQEEEPRQESRRRSRGGRRHRGTAEPAAAEAGEAPAEPVAVEPAPHVEESVAPEQPAEPSRPSRTRSRRRKPEAEQTEANVETAPAAVEQEQPSEGHASEESGNNGDVGVSWRRPRRRRPHRAPSESAPTDQV